MHNMQIFSVNNMHFMQIFRANISKPSTSLGTAQAGRFTIFCTESISFGFSPRTEIFSSLSVMDRENKLAFSGSARPILASDDGRYVNFSRRGDAPAPTGTSILS
jgi:hypothetical protein